MIFNEYVEQYKGIKEFFESEEVRTLIENLQSIATKYDTIKNNTINTLTVNRGGDNASSYMKLHQELISLSGNTSKEFKTINKTIFNILSGYEYTNISDFWVALKELNSIISDIGFENSSPTKIKLILRAQDNIDNILKIYNENILLYENIINIQEELLCNQSIIEQKGLETFQITLNSYDNETDYDYILNMSKDIKQIYDGICNILNIESDQRKLIPVKTESGCLYQALAGDPYVVWLLTSIIQLGIKNAYNYYTLYIKSKREPDKTLIKHLEEAIDIHNVLEEFKNEKEDKDNPITINDKFLEDEGVGQIYKSIINIAKNNKNVKINECNISIQQEITKQQMVEFSMKYIDNKE